ncbi:type II secretion system F family protein, partial [Mycolicibacterium farcinogenes]|nr:type II secretion system F family protein [Mycolicibacterium farcinogenes]
MSWAALFLAAALWIGADPARVRDRALPRPVLRAVRQPPSDDDPLAAASTFDLFAACLSSGMAVSTAAAAATSSAPPALAQPLRRASELLALGADPSRAWAAADDAATRARAKPMACNGFGARAAGGYRPGAALSVGVSVV